MRPTVAFPHLPENTKAIDEAGEIAIDQVVIGSCTNGRLNDMKIAAEILRGKQVHPKVRTIVIPATQQIYLDCIRLGYVEDIVKAGAIFSTPTWVPALAGTWGFWQQANAAYPQRTETLSAEWVIQKVKCIWQAPQLRQHLPSQAILQTPKRLQEGWNNGNSKRESL